MIYITYHNFYGILLKDTGFTPIIQQAPVTEIVAYYEVGVGQ